MIEWIFDGSDKIALIIKSGYLPLQTEFLTPGSYKQQVGLIIYNKDGYIRPHDHKKISRVITGTSEVLLVKKGKMEACFYTDKRKFVCSRIVEKGDIILLVNGGHSFKMLEDTVLLEIKQGPYSGVDEKEYFEE